MKSLDFYQGFFYCYNMLTIEKLILYPLLIAGLSLFFQECMKYPMIFRRYFLWLVYHWRKNWRKKDKWKRKVMLLQPLGLCVYCNSSWVAIAYYIYKFGLNIDVFLFLGATFLWVE